MTMGIQHSTPAILDVDMTVVAAGRSDRLLAARREGS
jgi:hypothetical protein